MFVTPIAVHEKLRGGDIFRDVASAANIQHSRFLADPAYRGHTLWYPPLSPAIMAGFASAFDITPVDGHCWSQLLFNWMIPAGLFLVVRFQWGRRAAVAAATAPN